MPVGGSGGGLGWRGLLGDGVLPPDYPLLAGVADGDLVGELVGVVFQAGTAAALRQGELKMGSSPWHRWRQPTSRAQLVSSLEPEPW